MANNLIDLPKIEDMSNGLFGKSDPFAAQKPAASVSSLLGDFVKDANKPIELSAGAQKMVTEGLNAAQNAIELGNKTNAAIQNQIETYQAQQAAALKQQQAIQQQRVEQEKLRQAAIKEQEAKQKELEKEIKEKIKADPRSVAQPRANVLLNSPEYKAASTEKKKDMVASFLANQKAALAAEIKDPDLQTAVFNETQGLLYSQLNKDIDAIVNDGSHFFSDLKTSVASFSKGLLGGYEGSKAASISKDIETIKSGISAIENRNLLSEATQRQLANYTMDKPLPQPLRNAIVNELSGKLTEQVAKADRYYQQQKDIKEGYSAEVKDSLANAGYTKAKKELELAKEGKQLTLAGHIVEGAEAAKGNWYALGLDSITPMLASIGTALLMRNAPKAATIAASTAAGGLFTSSDVVSSARDAILSADDAQLKRIKGWDAALAQAGGNKELARRNIATVAANDKAGVGFLMGAVLSVFGPETLASLAVGKVLSRGAAQAAVGSVKTAVAKNVGLFGAGVVSEGLEEGATQYLANVAAAEADPMKDVGYNAGIGGVLGGVMSAAPTIASTTVDVLNARALNPNAGPTPSGRPPVSGDVLSDLVQERLGLLQNLADAGKLDTSSINKVLYEGLERIPSEVPPQGGASTGYSGRQAFFDAVYESDILQNRLTPEQQAEIKSYIATAFSDINTNPYDYAAKTAELLAFYASDANSASSDMTKDAIAAKTGNGAAISDPVLATATMQALQAIDPNINESTKERMLRWTTMIRPDIYERNPDLTEEQKNQLDRYMHDYIDVTPRRMTDAQVAQQQAGLNQVPPSAQPVAGQPTQVQSLMGTNVPGATTTSSAQGSGNNLAQQTFTPTNLLQPAPQISQSPSGSVAQPAGGNPVGQASQAATTPTASSGPLIGTGTTGQTNSGQSTGQPGSVTAPTPVSSGSAAATQAERNANAQRAGAPIQGTKSVTLANGTTVTAPARPTQTIALPSGNTATVSRPSTPVRQQLRQVSNSSDLLSQVEPLFARAEATTSQEKIARMMDAFVSGVRNGLTNAEILADVDRAYRVQGPVETTKVKPLSGRLHTPLNDPSAIGMEVTRNWETGILVQRGKNIFFVPYNGDSDIHVGDVNTTSSLYDLGFRSANTRGPRTTNQIANRTNQAGRQADAIWEGIYSALLPSTTEQEVDAALAESLQTPITDADAEAEFNEALNILTEYFNGDENAALDALETLALSDEQLLADLSSGDLNTQTEAVLNVAASLESTKLYNDYQDALELAYEYARDLNEVDLLESAVSGLVENYPNVSDRIAILEDYVNNSSQSVTTQPANVGPITQVTPEYTLTTSSPNITGAVEQLLLPPSQRTGKRKLTSKSPAVKERIRKVATSDIHVGSIADRMFAYIDNNKLAVKREQNGVSTIGSLTRENGRIVFVPDDGALPSVEITGIDKMSTFNSYNKKSTVDTLTPTVPLHMTEGFINNRIPNYDSTAKTNAPTQKTRVSPIESVAAQRAAEATATTADQAATANQTEVVAPAQPEPAKPTGPKNLSVTLSASTPDIPGLAALQRVVEDMSLSQDQRNAAANLLNSIAFKHLQDLVSGVEGITLTPNPATGLYGGSIEPSLLVDVTATDEAMPYLLAALAKFGDNLNQREVHIREETTDTLGAKYSDGSYTGMTYQIELNQSLDRARIEALIEKSGLFGLTVYPNESGNSVLEFYFYGDVDDTNTTNTFQQSASTLFNELGASLVKFTETPTRTWLYGNEAAIEDNGFVRPYSEITGGLRTQPSKKNNAITSAIAEYINPTARPFDQQDITPAQRELQRNIARAYDEAPLYDLDNPLVRRAYTELAQEVKAQYLAMPLKSVELLKGQGEPYANSDEMRDDIRLNNKLKVFATTPDSFGSNPNIDYSTHPLMQDSGIKDVNGEPMLMNDLFRAVHDYYAHTMSPVAFGPKGEEAAWKNHLSMTKSPWAAWALTAETRGQNSWVNFRDGVENIPIKDRPFADQKTALLPLEYTYTGDPAIDAKLDTLKNELSANEQQGSLAEPEVEPTTQGQSNKDLLWEYTGETDSAYDTSRYYSIDYLPDSNSYLAFYIIHPTGESIEKGTRVFKTLNGAKNFIRRTAYLRDTEAVAAGVDTIKSPDTGTPAASRRVRNDFGVLVHPLDKDVLFEEQQRADESYRQHVNGEPLTARQNVMTTSGERVSANNTVEAAEDISVESPADNVAAGKQADTSNSPQNSVETVQEAQLPATTTEARLDTVAPNQIKAAFARKLLTSEEKASLGVGELKGADLISHVTDLLTSPQENLTDVQSSALDKIAGYVDKGFADRQLNRQKANRSTDKSAGQKTVADVITTQERDVVDAFLESRNEEDVTAEDLVEQVISNRVNRDAPSDPLITAAEADSRIKRIIDRIWNAIKNTVAVVAVALAAYTGVASNNDAYAATTPITVTSPIATLTQDANAAHQYIQQNRDNANKPYIIADKKGGAVHLFDAQGNLLATTPALFGKNISDTTRAGATPAGKFTIKYASTPAEGYGGTVQALANSSGQLVQSSIGTVSIHRTYTMDRAENRPARLASKSVTDNRISNGCINVPSSFYNAHLDSVFDGYVYVLPETKPSPYRPRGAQAPAATTQRATELRAPTRVAKTTTQTTVPASTVVAAQAVVEPVVTETISTAPITIEGTKPSGQVAMVKPVAINGVSHSTMNVPQGTHTPLEQSTKPAFDTVAPDVQTENGWDIAAVVLGLLSNLGAGALVVNGRRRLRKLNNQLTAVESQGPTPAAAAVSAAASTANVQVPQSTTPSPVPATPTTSAAQQFKINELASAMHQAQWFDYMTRVGGLDEAVLQDLFFAETNLFRTMTDKSLQQALENDLQAKPWNVGDRLPGKLKGALGTIIYLTNGAKPALDNLLIKYGAPVVGVESDSPRFSMILSAIGGMANAAVREMTTANITPITKKLEKLSYKYHKGFQEIAEDFGRYATLDHLLSEGFDEHIRAKEGEIDTYVQIMALQDAIIADPNSSAREVSAAEADRSIAARNRTRLENQLLVIRSTIEGTTTPIDEAVADQYSILTAHQTAMQVEVVRYNRTIAAQDAVLADPNASAKDKNTASKTKNSAIAKRDAQIKRIDDIQDTLDSLPFVLDPALLLRPTPNVNSAQRTDEIRQATTKLSQLVNARSKLVLDANNNVLWNGDTDANGNVVEGQVKMPGGYTRRQAQQEFDRLKSMYDTADLEGVAADIVKAYNRATIFAGASGVYRASDYKRFKDIGFKKYVALYRKSLTPADLNPTNEENVESSELADLLRKYPTRQVRSLGLQDDVTRYSRDGSSEPAADAYTNLLLFTRQHGSLIAQAPLRKEIELLYEGTWQNVNQTGVFSTKRLEELEQRGEIPGIVRYLPGKEPANLKDVRPISAWGHIADANGNQQYVRMNYYFTDTVIQEQIGRNITLGESADGNGLLGGIMAETRAYTRFASRLMTRFNPRFQLFTNVFNETWERATTAAFRDVVDVNGNPVSVTSLTASHAAHVAENMTIGKRREIYRYITTGEVKTKLQYVLHEMYSRGAIHLQTDLVEKQNMMEEYKKALSTRALDAAGSRLKRLANKSEVVGSAVDMSEDALDFMLMQLSEVTQVALVLASAQAYIDNGVNLAEASNRIRDSFDAMRAPNWQTKMGALFPFVRATMSGVYNNIRSLTQTEGQASKVAGIIIPKYITSMALLLATNLTLLGLAASLLGDDDDDDNGNGTPLLAKLPSTAFKQGVPLPNPFGDGIIYLPIGHGIGSAMWQMAASLYRTANGTNDTTGLMGDLITIVVENTLPIQLASCKLFGNEMGDWAVLSMTPQILKPIVELATNRNSFTGAEIIRATTPRGERDSAQGNFKMPQGYRDLAAGLYDVTFGAVDMRPETIQHLSKGYFGYGPLRALDASFQDLSEATGGTRERRSEQAGSLAPIAALMGFGTFVDNQSLQADILSFGVQDKAYNKLAQYGVELTDPNNKPGEAINTIVNKLIKEGATPADIAFIKNTLEFTKERKALEKQFADEAKSYNEQRAKGVPADATRMQTLQANIDILTRNYVKENSKYE